MQETNEPSNVSPMRKGFVPSLVLANFSTNMMDFLVGLFLVDIAVTFFGSSGPNSIALASQLITISNSISVAFGLLMGLLSIRFRYKSLLLIGLACVAIGAIGCFAASGFVFLQIFYPLDGIGTIAIGAMVYTLAGEHLPINKRGKALGFIIAGSPLAGLIGSITINLFFGTLSGWRFFMLMFVLPVAVSASVLTYFKVPSTPHKKIQPNKELFKRCFKQVFLRKTSTACLIGNLIRYTGAVWATFAISFIRTRFNLSAGEGAIIVLFGTVGLVFGMILAGQLVNRVGRKRLLIFSTVSVGFSILPIVYTFDLRIALMLYMLAGVLGGLSFSADINFTLEQTPEARGTMMSMNSSFVYLGTALGAAIGGAVLAVYGYEILAFTLVTLDFTAATIFFALTDEPCPKTEKKEPQS